MLATCAAVPTVYPGVLGHEVNLYRLYRTVSQLGGFDAVEEQKQWPAVVAICVHAVGGLAHDTRACGKLRTVYQQHLLAFERSAGEACS